MTSNNTRASRQERRALITVPPWLLPTGLRTQMMLFTYP